MKKENLLNQKTILSFEDLFIIIGSSIFLTSWFAFALTEFQIFYNELLRVLLIAIAAILILILRKLKLKRIAKIDIVTLILVFIFACFNTYYAHETFFGGRDDGMYANQATYMVKNHTFYIKNPVVSSFPGHVKTQNGYRFPFYIGYPAWIASHIALLGIPSAKYSNFILLLIGMLSFYFVGKKLMKSRLAFASLILFMTTYPMFWFTRRTFSEIYVLALFWFSFLCLLNACKKSLPLYLAPSFLAFSLALVSRGEALVSLIIYFLILLFLHLIKRQRWVVSKYSFLSLIFFFPALFYNFVIDTSYVNATFSRIANFIINFTFKGVTSTGKPTLVEASMSLEKNALEFHLPSITWRLLSYYLLSFFIIFTFFSLLKILRSYHKEKSLLFAIVLLLALPSFFYLLNPSISLDQPWFLRRFLPLVLPTSFLAFCYTIEGLPNRVMVPIFSFLILVNIINVLPILTFQEFNGALIQLSKINQTKLDKKTSLILVDYNNLGHYKLAEPLFYVYDYNSVAVTSTTIKNLLHQLNEKETTLYGEGAFSVPNICNYSSVYILTNKEEEKSLRKYFPEDSLVTFFEFPLHYKELIEECELFRLTEHQLHHEIAHLDIDTVKEYCQRRPQEFYDTYITAELLKLKDEITWSLKESYNCKNKET